MPGGQHLQNPARRDGTPLQSHGAIAGSAGAVQKLAGGRAGWQQTADARKLRGGRQAQTNAQRERQRAKKTSDGGGLPVWVEKPGGDRGTKAPSAGP